MTTRRNRRSGVEDLWHKDERGEDGIVRRVPSKLFEKGKRWRARYVDDLGEEFTRRFTRKTDAQQWLDEQVSAIVQGSHIAPRDASLTVRQWCDEWMRGYGRHRDTTVHLAESNIKRITAEFGDMPLSTVRPSMVKAWVAKMKAEELADSYIYLLHNRLSQIMADAVHDRLLARNPCSRRTSPGSGQQKPYVATTDQVWALHDAVPEHIQSAVLLGAFVGLRISEAAALRVSDVDFIRGIVHPKQQWPAQPLKTKSSDALVPIPQELSLLLSASVKKFHGENLVCTLTGRAISDQSIARYIRQARENIPGLPETFSFHDLRHYYASLLISKGADVKLVQARLRHGSAVTTLRFYAHLWPDADESTRLAVGDIIRESAAYSLRTGTPEAKAQEAISPAR